MSTYTEKQLLEALNHRCAVKAFKKGEQIPEATWAALEESLLLSPSSYGQQPYEFFVVDNPETRAKLRAVAWDQSQFTDAAKLIVFASRTDLTAADGEKLIKRIAEVRHVPLEALDGFKGMVLGNIASKDAATLAAWAHAQVYIPLGVILTAAATLGVDACPMEGFNPDEVDKILGLKEKGLHARAAVALGRADPDNWYYTAAKVRFPKEQVIHHV